MWRGTNPNSARIMHKFSTAAPKSSALPALLSVGLLNVLKSTFSEAVLSSTNAVKEGVKAGLGISVLSLLAVQTELANGVLKTVRIQNCQPLRRDFFAVVNKRLTLSPIAQSFLEFLHSRAEELTPTSHARSTASAQ